MPPTVSAVTHGLAAALRIRRSHRCERRHFSRHLAPPFLSSSSITRTRRCHAPRAATLGRHTAVQGGAWNHHAKSTRSALLSSLEEPLGFRAEKAPQVRETRVRPGMCRPPGPNASRKLPRRRGPGRRGAGLRPAGRDTHLGVWQRPAPSSPVLSFAEKPGELSLARLGLGGPSSKFSAIFTCARKQPPARAAGPTRAPGRGSARPRPAARGEARARAASEPASAEGEGGRRPGGGGGGQISATATAPRSAHRPPPAAAAAAAGRGPLIPCPPPERDTPRRGRPGGPAASRDPAGSDGVRPGASGSPREHGAAAAPPPRSPPPPRPT